MKSTNTPQENIARLFFESIFWPNGPVCPYCKNTKSWTMHNRFGYYKCSSCRSQYTVRVGTILHGSHMSYQDWLLVIRLICSAEKGIAALQLKRLLSSTYVTAWYMSHRVRCAMVTDFGARKLQGIVEVDEIYLGNRKKQTKYYDESKIRKQRKSKKKSETESLDTTTENKPKKKRGRGTSKTPVLVLVERGGQSIAVPMTRLNRTHLTKELLEHVALDATIISDGYKGYCECEKIFAEHKKANHSQGLFDKEGEHVNTVESFNSLMRRGYYGVFHQYTDRHLHRYCVEMSFKRNHCKYKLDNKVELLIKKMRGRVMLYRHNGLILPVYAFKKVLVKNPI